MEDDNKVYKIGKCPYCGGNILYGNYGAFCSKRCGMYLRKAMGKRLTEQNVRDLLANKGIILENLVGKSGSCYDAYLKPVKIVDYDYTDRNGNQVQGHRFAYEISFPKHTYHNTSEEKQ